MFLLPPSEHNSLMLHLSPSDKECWMIKNVQKNPDHHQNPSDTMPNAIEKFHQKPLVTF